MLTTIQRLLWSGMVCCCLALAGCDTVFDVHPYDVHIRGEKNLNAKGVAAIEAATRGKDTLRLAFISDSHRNYNELRDMVADINRRDSIDFVVHGGDVTDYGTTREYEWARDNLARLRKPYVVLLGNHDCLGTGNAAYESIFGQPDFRFIAGRVKFVCLTANAIEYDYSRPVPNFDFMEQEMTARGDEFDRTVVCMHAAPYSEQFNNNVAKVFNYYVMRFPQPLFCLYGHGHHTEQHDIYGNGLIYYEVGNAQKRKYYIFTITPNGYSYEIVEVLASGIVGGVRGGGGLRVGAGPGAPRRRLAGVCGARHHGRCAQGHHRGGRRVAVRQAHALLSQGVGQPHSHAARVAVLWQHGPVLHRNRLGIW